MAIFYFNLTKVFFNDKLKVMKNILKPIRNKIICDAWKKYKSQGLKMVELAEIFKLDTPHIFYILKKDKEK